MKWIVLLASAAGCGGAAMEPSAATPATKAPEAESTATTPNPHAELDRAENELRASQSDCASACRSLASMQRAAERLCALDAGAECDQARQRVDAARAQVLRTCGPCPS